MAALVEIFDAVMDSRAIIDAVRGFPTLQAAAASLAHVIADAEGGVVDAINIYKGYREMKTAHRMGSQIHDSAQSPINRKRSRTDDGEADDVVKRLRMPVAHSRPRRHGLVDLAWTPIVTC